MLCLRGAYSPFDRGGVHRREMLRAGGLAAMSLSLPAWLRLQELSAKQRRADQYFPRSFGKAKRILLLYLQGAASQFETWDPKPHAPAEIRGNWGAGATATPGVVICDQLPKVARIVDRLAIVRSMTHDYNNHSNLYTLTGYPAVDFSSETTPFDSRHHPFFGSVLDYCHDRETADEALPRRSAPSDVPQNIGLPFRFSTYSPVFRRAGPYGGFLGHGYDPVWTQFDGKAIKSTGRVSFFNRFQTVEVDDPYLGITSESRLKITHAAQLRPDITLDRLDRRLRLRDQLQTQQRRLQKSPPGKSRDRFEAMAYTLMTSGKLRNALDIGKEPRTLREQYGMTLFGQAALTGRRLLEAGCRLVSVFWDEYKVVNTAWDTHFNHTSRLGDELLPGFDAAVSALVLDLEQRGMLDDTLVLCLTEHGRTPRVSESKRGGGRDHWSKAYSVMLAGAGVARGAVVGASDAHGAFVKDRPLNPEDILATMYHLAGVDPETTIPDRLARPVKLTAHGQVVQELLA